MKKLKTPYAARVRRHERVRRKVRGTPERPRLCVFRSLSHIYAQIIDDTAGKTLVAAADVEREVKDKAKGKDKSAAAGIVGEVMASRAKEKGLSRVVFDRGGYQFHGRVKALAEAARAAGLEF